MFRVYGVFSYVKTLHSLDMLGVSVEAVDARGSVVQWFCGSEESVVAQKRQRLRGNHLDCK